MWERIPASTLCLSIMLTISMLVSQAHAADRTTHPLSTNVELWDVHQQWDDAAEKEFSKWVKHLGEARGNRVCLRLKGCLNNPKANTLWQPGEQWRHIFADCADLPYVLRAYFSYRTGRPFQFTSIVSGSRYTRRNKVAAIADFTDPRFTSPAKFLRKMSAWVHSGYFRTRPDRELTDTYPVAVNRQTIVPGTVFYEPRGHVLVVVDVKDNGNVHMIDGHPDNSLTYKIMSPKNARPGRSARTGGGFRNWRRYTYSRNDDNVPTFVRETNSDIAARHGGFDGSSQYGKRFDVDGESVDYWTWVKAQLTRPSQLSWRW